MTNRADIERQASEWLIEQEDPEFSEDQKAQFEAWLAENPSHREAYGTLDRAWRRVDALRERLKSREGMRKTLVRQLMRTRDLNEQDALQLAQSTVTRLREACDTSVSSSPVDARCLNEGVTEDVVASCIAREWFCAASDLPWARFGSSWEFALGSLSHVPSQESVANAFRVIVERTLENLPHRTRRVYTLRKCFGYTASEIAGELDLSDEDVGYHLDRAVYEFASRVINDFSPEQQAVLFSSLIATQVNARRRGLG